MSDISFNCPDCGAEIEADESLSGDTARCPGCNNTIMIPVLGIKKGILIAGFEVVKKLGAGGMGEVWLARQKAMERDVALKILSPALTKDKDFVSRFMQEVKMAGKLEHPNIVTAFDAGKDHGIYYLAISFVDGEELGDKLEKEKIIPEKEALKIMRDIACALKYAWDKYKILHRDIKPANIMISRDDGSAKLMDMGISKSMSEDAQLTMTGMIMGTPYYMSPEQAMAEEQLDFRADLYSLGATLYHIVTGEQPYDATTAMGILTKHISEPFPNPLDRNSELSEQCAVLLEIMMAKKEEDRHSSWGELIEDIDRVIEGQFPRSSRPGIGESVIMDPTSSKALGKKKDYLESQRLENTQGSDYAATAYHKDKEKSGGLFIYFLIVLLILAVVASLYLIHIRKQSRVESANGSVDQITHSGGKDDPDDDDFKPVDNKSGLSSKKHDEMWNYALKYAKDNPDDYDGVISKFQDIKDQLADTKYRLMAVEQINKVSAEREKAVEETFKKIRGRAEKLASDGFYMRAMRFLRDYNDKFADETFKRRMKQLDDIRSRVYEQQKKKREEERLAREKQNELISKIISLTLRGRYDSAYQEYKRSGIEIKSLENPLEILSSLRDFLIKSLEKDIGNNIKLYTLEGDLNVFVKKVQYPNIYIQENLNRAVITKKIPMNKLTVKEICNRLAAVDKDAARIYAAVQFLQQRKYDSCQRLANDLPSELSEPISNEIYLMQFGRESAHARNEFFSILFENGIKTRKLDFDIIKEQLNAEKMGPEEVRVFLKKLTEFHTGNTNNKFVKSNNELIGKVFNFVKKKISPLDMIPESTAEKIKNSRNIKGERLIVTAFRRRGSLGIQDIQREVHSGDVIEINGRRFPDNSTIELKNLENITITSSPDKRFDGFLILDIRNCKNVSLSSLNGTVAVRSLDSDITLVDSNIYAFGCIKNNTKVLMYNSSVSELSGGSGKFLAVHCNFRMVKFMGTPYSNNARFLNCLLIGKMPPMTDRQRYSTEQCFRFSKGQHVKLQFDNSLIYSYGQLAVMVNKIRPSAKRAENILEHYNSFSSMDEFVEFANCINEKPDISTHGPYAFRLKPGSPGINAASDSRTVGANVNSKGFCVPFE